MLNKPKYMIPSTNMQQCVIDVKSKTIPFSCIVDGNESIYAWQIVIYSLNDNAVVMDTGKQELLTPFFPVDNKNKNVVFKQDLKSFISSEYYIEKCVNSPSPYYWTISFWSAKDKLLPSPSITSCEEVFFANSSVDVSIEYVTDNSTFIELEDNLTISSSKCYFRAKYTQNEDVGVKRYGWRIKDVNNNKVLVDTISQKQIYGTEDNIVCSYDGFLNGESYSVEVYIETQNGAVIITEPIVFFVSYEITYLSNDFKVESLDKEAAIVLDWTEASIIGGRETIKTSHKTQYPIVNYKTETPNTSVIIPENGAVIFDSNTGSSNLNISDNSYMVISTQMENNDERVLLSAEGTDDNGYELLRNLRFNGEKFIYSIVGANGIPVVIETDEKYSPDRYKWYVITLSPLLGENGVNTWIRVVESKAINCIYPREDFYPQENNSKYPTFGTWDKLKGGDS